MSNTDCLNGKFIKMEIYSGTDPFEAKDICDIFTKSKDREQYIKIQILDHTEVEVKIERVILKEKEDMDRDYVTYKVEFEGIVVSKDDEKKSVWKNNDNNKYLMYYWGFSTIGWQQANHDILNASIRVYNDYVMELRGIDEVQSAVYYAESRLRNEPGNYMDTINLIKKAVDEIEEAKY